MVVRLDSRAEAKSARSLLERIAARRARGLSQEDRDDLIQKAMEKALGQHQLPGSPPLKVRVQTTFDDVFKDHFRADSRRREVLCAEPQEHPETPRDLEARMDSLEACRDIHRQLGEEVSKYAFLRADGFTDPEIAQLDGWDEQRVARVRKQLERKRDLLTMAPIANPKREVS